MLSSFHIPQNGYVLFYELLLFGQNYLLYKKPVSMFELEEATLTECPPFNKEMVDSVISRYCAAEIVYKEKTVIRNINSIIVTKRKNAILSRLYTASKPIHVFGEVEMSAIKTGY